jgi:hypothetical protein
MRKIYWEAGLAGDWDEMIRPSLVGRATLSGLCLFEKNRIIQEQALNSTAYENVINIVKPNIYNHRLLHIHTRKLSC